MTDGHEPVPHFRVSQTMAQGTIKKFRSNRRLFAGQMTKERFERRLSCEEAESS